MASSNPSRRGVSTAGRAHQTSHRMVTRLVLPHTVRAPIKEDVAVARFDGKKLGALDWIGVLAGGFAGLGSFLSWRHVRGTRLVGPARAVGLKTWYTALGRGGSRRLPVLLPAGPAVP